MRALISTVLVLVSLPASAVYAQEPVPPPPAGGAPSTPPAADTPPSDAEVQEAADAEANSLDSAARSLFEAGRLAYSEARYEDALQRFEQAYEISQRPGLLFNIAQTLDRLRRDSDAITAFETFLASNPPEVQRAYAETRLEALRRSVAAAPTPEETAMAPDPDEPAPYVEAPPPETRSGPKWGLIAAIIGAVVVVSVAVAVPLALRDPEPTYVQGNVGNVFLTLGSAR